MIGHKCVVCGHEHAACCGSCTNYAAWVAAWAQFFGPMLSGGLEDEIKFLRFTMGISEQAVTERVDSLRCYLHDVGRDEDEDRVLDLLDRLVGWCAPHRWLVSDLGKVK